MLAARDLGEIHMHYRVVIGILVECVYTISLYSINHAANSLVFISPFLPHFLPLPCQSQQHPSRYLSASAVSQTYYSVSGISTSSQFTYLMSNNSIPRLNHPPPLPQTIQSPRINTISITSLRQIHKKPLESCFNRDTPDRGHKGCCRNHTNQQ